MKTLSRILTVILCCTPAFSAVAAGNVATTAGSNLTAYNPSDTYNNQWASLTNGRYDDAPSGPAKADFGNCNALVLRCAQPKCGGGGCTDYGVAGGIVAGCVQSNDKCKKYGDDLVNYMTAQLVASSQTKLNQQQMALEQAKIQADAQAAAAAAANAQSQEQIAQMQSQMQQMQAQMAQQQAESAAQLQAALDAQAAQSAAALNDMKEAATAAAKQTEAGITAYQQEAIDRGVSNDTLLRQTMTGQIKTAVDDMNRSLENAKRIMQESFRYAGCTPRGDNCTGPKRVKKWRELASDFIEPYDNAVEKLEDALNDAQIAGVDLSQIYAMLDNACSSWSQYLCPYMADGAIEYSNDDSGGQRGAPKVCGPNAECKQKCHDDARAKIVATGAEFLSLCYSTCEKNNCKPCTWLKALTSEEDIYEGWVYAEDEVKGNTTVVACGASALNRNKIIGGRSRRKNGAGVVSMDQMETWLYQREPDTNVSKLSDKSDLVDAYCTVNSLNDLQKAAQSRSVPTNKICVYKRGEDKQNGLQEDECPYINKTYAICDTHAYNWASSGNTPVCNQTGDPVACELDSEQIEKIKEVVALKTTVISQQMYKQYEYLKATLRRFEVLLNKALLTSTFETAGAKDEDGSSSRAGGLAGGGSSKNSQYTNCSGKDREGTLYCLRQNYSALAERINNKKCNKVEKDQLEKDIGIIQSLTKKNFVYDKDKDCSHNLGEYNAGLIGLQDEIEERNFKLRGWGDRP